MPTYDNNLTLQVDITRVALQALITAVTVIPRLTYRITDAVGATKVVLVKGETASTITRYAINETDDTYGIYDIVTDVFTIQAGSNIYNSDGQIAANRTVDGNSKTLTWNNVTTWLINGLTRIKHIVTNGSDSGYVDIVHTSVVTKVQNGSDVGTHTITKSADAANVTDGNLTGKATVLAAIVQDSVTNTSTGYVTSESIQDGAMTTRGDDPAFEGDKYFADYSAQFTARSKVDKGYVDSVVAGLGDVDSVSGDSVDNTDPQNPVVNAIPYDASLQTQDINGSYSVDPTNGETKTVTNAGATTSRDLQDQSINDFSNDGTNTGRIDISPGSAGIKGEVNATGHRARIVAEITGGAPEAFLEAYDNVTLQKTSIRLLKDEMLIRTPGVDTATATNGQVLTLIDDTTGESEFQDPPGGTPTTVGGNIFTLANPGALSRLRLNADNSVTAVPGGIAVLSANRTNTTNNVLSDVTDLSFAMVAGVYKFRAYISYTSGNTGNGCRFTINTAATITALNYYTRISLSATAYGINEGLTAVQLPAAASTTSATSGEAIVEGVIHVSTSGTLQIQFASEANTFSIIALANISYLEYEKIG